jgi:hypothetical protein
MDVAEQTTCGRGLAQHSSLPMKMGELATVMAEQLELHTKALDLNEENARKEQVAYENLAQEHRDVAARLQAIGEEMAGYRELPMGAHDMQVLTAPELSAALQNLVKVEQELLALVEERVGEHEAMLMMDEAGRSTRER